jgi:DNA-binding MarR family transcriptional regulator
VRSIDKKPAGKPLDLHRYVPANITFLSYKLSRGASKLYQRNFGVSSIEWRIMALLANEPGISGRRVCDVIGLDKGAVSRSLAFMQERRLVSIHKNADGREQLATLTERGRALHDRIAEVARERERRLLSCLSAAERKTLAALLDRVHQNIGVVDEPLDIRPLEPEFDSFVLPEASAG